MIHPSASVSPQARIGTGVSIGPFTIIHADVEIGAGSKIDGFCEIGYPNKAAAGKPLVLGADTLIRSHSVFYAGSTFGAGLMTGHRVTVRENTRAGLDLHLGTLCDLQGDCDIGDYVRMHSNVHIGKLSRIGNFVWIFPYVVMTNDPHPPSDVSIGCAIDDFAAVATMSVILPGVTVGKHALVAAHSMVGKDVAPSTVVGGSPARYICDTAKIRLKDGSERPAYPWTSHFRRGYPAEVTAGWDAPETLPPQA